MAKIQIQGTSVRIPSTPGFHVGIDLSAFRRLAKAIPNLTLYMEEEIERGMNHAGELMTTLVVVRTPTNYGLLRSSISWPSGFELESGMSGDLEWRGIVGASDQPSVAGTSTMDYVWYVEFGTEPHWAPAGPLILWASRKFDLGDKEAKRIGYAVQRNIAKYGTKGAHMFERAWTEGGREGVSRIFERVPVRALKRWEDAYPKEASSYG